MKKIFFWGIISIILGFLIGEIFFNNKNLIFNNVKPKGETYYFLQEGVYANKNTIKNSLNNFKQKIVEKQDKKYYVYVGITKDKEVADKLKNIYEEKGYPLVEKVKYLSNEEFSNNISQFDLLIKATDESDEILTIEEVVLASYDEIIKNSSKN